MLKLIEGCQRGIGLQALPPQPPPLCCNTTVVAATLLQMACTARTLAMVVRTGSAARLSVLLVLALLVLPVTRGQALGLDRKTKEIATKRFLKQLADLNLWAGVVACSDGAGDAVYKVRAAALAAAAVGGALLQGCARVAAGSCAPSRCISRTPAAGRPACALALCGGRKLHRRLPRCRMP